MPQETWHMWSAVIRLPESSKSFVDYPSMRAWLWLSIRLQYFSISLPFSSIHRFFCPHFSSHFWQGLVVRFSF